MALTRINNQALTNVTSAGLPSGTVLQVKSTTDTTTATYSNNFTSSEQDLLSVSITPTSTSSKIMVFCGISAGHEATNSCYFKLYRDSTALDGAASGNRTTISFGQVHAGVYDDDDIGSSHFSYLDSPATTSSVTYKVVGGARTASNWGYNKCYDSGDNTGKAQAVSTITVMEIAG